MFREMLKGEVEADIDIAVLKLKLGFDIISEM